MKTKEKKGNQRNEEIQQIIFKAIQILVRELICLLSHLSLSPLPQKNVLLDNPAKNLYEQFCNVIATGKLSTEHATSLLLDSMLGFLGIFTVLVHLRLFMFSNNLKTDASTSH